MPRATDGFIRGTPPGADLARRSLLVIAAGTVAAFALLAQLGDNGIVAWWRLRGREAALQREVTKIATTNAELAQRLEDLAADPEALERLAREEYGMRAADEEVLTVVPATVSPGPSPQDP
ncbi:hypothetical protein DRQ50_09250 [bacterium]|nr:MAG: hypothetical protein DRQ50_09250 [bacterium]